MDKLLIIDDSTDFLHDVEALLSDCYDVVKATDGRGGLDILRKQRVMAVLLNLNLPDMYGTEVLKIIHSDIDPYILVIVVTDHADMGTVIEAMRHGAYDFIPKHFNLEILVSKITKALECRALHLGINALREEYLDRKSSFIFASDVMKSLHYEISRLARIDVDVILYGETGVGKDLVVSQIHLRSKRFENPYIPVSIRSLSDTLIESELFGH